jgi:hypothetical protein
MWTPTRHQQQERRRREGELQRMVLKHAALKDWNRELKQIDPYLELVFAPESADAPGLVPGRYHLLRHNPGAVPSLIPLQGPEGEFREPDSSIFQLLRESDLWNDQAERARRKTQEKLDQARERRRQREHEQRVEEMVGRAKARFEPGVLVKGVPWLREGDGKG